MLVEVRTCDFDDVAGYEFTRFDLHNAVVRGAHHTCLLTLVRFECFDCALSITLLQRYVCVKWYVWPISSTFFESNIIHYLKLIEPATRPLLHSLSEWAESRAVPRRRSPLSRAPRIRREPLMRKKLIPSPSLHIIFDKSYLAKNKVEI